MSFVSEKIEYLKNAVGLKISESDFFCDEITLHDGYIHIPVSSEKTGCVSIPESDGMAAAKMVWAYFNQEQTPENRIKMLLYKAFTGMITAGETVMLAKNLIGKEFFTVLLKTDSAEKCAYLADYLSAFASENDFIIDTNDGEIVYLKETDGGYDGSEELAEVLYRGITEERNIELVVCSGGFADKPEYIVRAYRRALDAFMAGEGNVRHYRDCALAALIDKAPVKALNDYYEYLTAGMRLGELDDELRETAKTFMDCGLSCSETAKKMYIHRNTLLKRLDKIAALTGLDVRNFRQAQIYDYIMTAEKALKNKKQRG